MGIEVVDPEKERLRGRLAEVGERPIGRLARRAFDLPCRQRVVVDVEAARESEPPREDERRDEGRGAVAGVLQSSGDDRVCVGKMPRVLVHAVPAGIEPGHHRTVRGQRLRRGRVRLAEAPAASRERVERGRLDAPRLRADRVGARRVERHEQDGRTRWRHG